MLGGISMAFIEFQKVNKIYQSGDVKVHALKDASFQIEQGEICVIVGQSGAGKTTLLNILGGMDVLTDGKIDPKKLKPIAYDPVNHTYVGLGDVVGKAFADGLKLK